MTMTPKQLRAEQDLFERETAAQKRLVKFGGGLTLVGTLGWAFTRAANFTLEDYNAEKGMAAITITGITLLGASGLNYFRLKYKKYQLDKQKNNTP